jgi:hypothetical protein
MVRISPHHLHTIHSTCRSCCAEIEKYNHALVDWPVVVVAHALFIALMRQSRGTLARKDGMAGSLLVVAQSPVQFETGVNPL